MLRSAMILALALLAVLAAAPARDASAQEPIAFVATDTRNDFPAGVTFSVSVRSASPVKEARLRYELAPDGTGATAVAECNTGATTNCTYTLTSGRGIFIIPGAEITWQWEISDEAGNRATSPEQLYVHEDTRFDFRAIEEGNVTVYFHSSTETHADAVAAAAAGTLTNAGALMQTQVGFPIKVFLYGTADEMQPAIAPSGGRGVQVLGEVVYSDTAMVSADVDVLDITRHEVAHIVTREASKGPYGVPDWMNEGISVFSQRDPLSGHGAALQAAIRDDRVLSMLELNSPSTGGVARTVGLYYGQAGSIVGFLVDTYGADKFAELIRTFREGSTNDKAYQAVYGFDEFGLENAWRESVGLPRRTAPPTTTPDAGDPATSGTPAPDGGDSGDAASDGGDDGGVSAVTLAVIGALAVAALGAIAALAAVARRRL